MKKTLRRLSALLVASVMTAVCGAANAFAEDEIVLAGDEIVLTDDEVALADDEVEIADDEAEITDDEAEITDDEAALTDDEVEIADDEAALTDDEIEIANDEAALADNVVEIADDEAELTVDEKVSLKLTEAKGIAGQAVVVNVVLESGNICTGYDIDVEFDDRLELKNVRGYMATETIGNVVTIVNLSAEEYEDNKPVSSLTFVLPDDADENDSYDINISRIGSASGHVGYIKNFTATGTTISVLESAKEVTNYMVYVTKEDGVEVSIVAPRGDADMDGEVGLSDAVGVVGKFANKRNLGDAGEFFADVNGDDKVDLFDALAIARFMLSSDQSNAWGDII